MDLTEIEKYAWYGLTALGLITAVTLPLMRLSHWFDRMAAATPQKSDDAVARAFVRVAESLHGTMTKVKAILQKIVGAPPALLVLLLLLPMSLSAACAGTHIDQTRTILLATDGYVDRIDARVGPLLTAAHVLAELEASDREDYDRRMRPWFAVDAAIEGVQVALVSAATTVDAVEAGQDRDIGGSIACAVEALMQLTEALPLVGVDVPPLLQTGIALLQGISSGFCPSPPAASPAASDPAPDPGEVSS